MKWRVRIVSQFLSLLITCAIVGAGVGFFLGEITARNWLRAAQIAFAEGASFIGSAAALVVGPILYWSLRRHISFVEFSEIVAFAAIVGGLAAFEGWEFLVPIAAVFATVAAAIAVRITRES